MGGPAHAMMTRANMARAGVPAGWQDDYDDGDMGEDDDVLREGEEYGDHEMDVEARAAAGVPSGEGGSRGGSRSQGSKYQGMNLYVKNLDDSITDEFFR